MVLPGTGLRGQALGDAQVEQPMLVEEFVRPALTIRHTASAAKARAFAEYAPQTVSAPAAEGGFGGFEHLNHPTRTQFLINLLAKFSEFSF